MRAFFTILSPFLPLLHPLPGSSCHAFTHFCAFRAYSLFSSSDMPAPSLMYLVSSFYLLRLVSNVTIFTKPFLIPPRVKCWLQCFHHTRYTTELTRVHFGNWFNTPASLSILSSLMIERVHFCLCSQGLEYLLCI